MVVNDLKIDVKKLNLTLHQKELEIQDLKKFPDIRKLEESVNSFVNSETIQDAVDRIMKDDVDSPITFMGSDVAEMLTQISSKQL